MIYLKDSKSKLQSPSPPEVLWVFRCDSHVLSHTGEVSSSNPMAMANPSSIDILIFCAPIHPYFCLRTAQYLSIPHEKSAIIHGEYPIISYDIPLMFD